MTAGRRGWGAAARRAAAVVACAAAALAAPALVAAVAGPAAAAKPGETPRSGDYCPLPKRGEKPRCLLPAEDTYGEFFAALDEGSVEEGAAARVEAELEDATRDDEDFLALSSLAYGYYRLAQRAATDPATDPRIAARLERWNRLLAAAYARDAGDERFRSAVREAARDLEANAPPVAAACEDADGKAVPCSSTEALRSQLDAADRVGVRGALARILERWFGR